MYVCVYPPCAHCQALDASRCVSCLLVVRSHAQRGQGALLINTTPPLPSLFYCVPTIPSHHYPLQSPHLSLSLPLFSFSSLPQTLPRPFSIRFCCFSPPHLSFCLFFSSSHVFLLSLSLISDSSDVVSGR